MEIQSIQNLKSKGVVNISYPAELRKSVESAVAAWEAFCKLPEELRTQFPYNKAAGMGVGYELKKTPGANLDLKEDFHITAGSRDWIENAAQTFGNPVALNFVTQAEKLIDLAEPLILDVAQSVETTFKLNGFRGAIADGKPIWFMRFLHYFGGRQEGDEIATPHADKSGFTLHLYESDPGLQYFDFGKEWREMPVSSGETAIIPGMRLQYASQNQLKATYHRVVATQKTAAQGRFSVVCFVHMPRTEKYKEYNKEKAGRLQEFQPGFNYEMPFEEFSKLFI